MFAKSFTHPSAQAQLITVLQAGCKQKGARPCCPIVMGTSEQHGDNHRLGKDTDRAWTCSSQHQHGTETPNQSHIHHSHMEAIKKALTP